MIKTPQKNPILVTGGMGYIGSHTVVELQTAGYRVVILDNLSNSSKQVLKRIRQITGQQPEFVEGDIGDGEELTRIFSNWPFDAVVHFAGLKAVGESVAQPLRYYQNNVGGSITLFDAMDRADCRRLVFSSSATVYGDPATVPIDERAPLFATNPYGQTKLIIENMLRDLQGSDPRWQTSILRYFNPVAAHSSGLIGEDPNGIPNNLLPYIAQVAVGRRKQLTIYGDDYDTPDGTGIRDYVHVVDLARAHLAALNTLNPTHGCRAYNIGTGRGYSVKQMVNAFAQASGRDIAFQIGPRRAGDIATCYADPGRANKELGWRARANLEQMMQDHWRWQKHNPEGYTESS